MTDTTASAAAPHFRLSFQTLGPVLALIALIILGASLNSNFLSYGNVTNVLARSAFIGIIAVGMTFVITGGGIDLSVGSMAAFVAGVMIMAMNAMVPSLGIGVPLVLAGMAVGLLTGLAAGLLNGILIAKAGIEAFIVTLGAMGIYRSLTTWLADGGTLSLDFEARTFYRPVYYDGLLGVAWPIIVFAVVAVELDEAVRMLGAVIVGAVQRPVFVVVDAVVAVVLEQTGQAAPTRGVRAVHDAVVSNPDEDPRYRKARPSLVSPLS